MRWLQAMPIALVCCAAVACSSKAAPHPAAPLRDIGLLSRRVRLPFAPSDVWFEEVPRTLPGAFGPADYVLVVVLRFAPAELEKLLTVSERLAGSASIPPIARRRWLSEQVANALHSCAAGVCVAGVSLSPRPFCSGAYLSGSMVVVDRSDLVLLELETS